MCNAERPPKKRLIINKDIITMEKLIITAAICGAEVTKEQNPAVPYTVDEIVREAKSAHEAGAAIVHLHVRFDDGTPTQSRERFQECTDAIYKACPDVILIPSTGIGRHAFPMAAAAIAMGGNVRVGFEDNLYLAKGVLAKSNGELVSKVVRIANELGRPIATSDEAREILGLKPRQL